MGWAGKEMDTVLLGHEQLQTAADLLRRGQLVAFPTETVYGLGADATNDSAVRAIYAAKGRPQDNPLIVHFASADAARQVVNVDEDGPAWAIARAFWPGPLTLVLPLRSPSEDSSAPQLSTVASAGLSTVGVRVPGNDIARRLIDLAGVPIAAPSANRSGKPSPTCARHVADDLSGRIAAIVDGEVSAVGLESTIVDGTRSPLVVLRPGGITLGQLRSVVGERGVVSSAEAQEGSASEAAPRAPGMKYVHYAPEAPVYFVEGAVPEECTAFIAALRAQQPPGASIALLTSLEPAAVEGCGADSVVRCGRYEAAESIGRELYACLRRFDEQKATGAIVCFGFPQDGVGEAVLNRLRKASQK
mmetsp:Transcript_11908/g.30126  ORF Transcript_11908/g.30126 Transcript_11908/m.30126 type:complete len:360 (+) Transcript_11908:1-1080(+)